MAEGQRHDRTALILYGSETGNSEDVAECLGRVAERLHFSTRVSEMDQIEIVRRLISRFRGLCLLISVERTDELYCCHICYIDHGTRGVSKEFEEVLEKSAEKTLASELFPSRGVYNFRFGRYFLPKVWLLLCCLDKSLAEIL